MRYIALILALVFVAAPSFGTPTTPPYQWGAVGSSEWGADPGSGGAGTSPAKQPTMLNLGFDDNRTSHATVAQPALAARGLKGTFFVHVRPWQGTDPINTALENELTEAQALAIAASGGDLQSHFGTAVVGYRWVDANAVRSDCTGPFEPLASCTGSGAWTSGDTGPAWTNLTPAVDNVGSGDIPRGAPTNLQTMLDEMVVPERNWAVAHDRPYFVMHRPPGHQYREFMSPRALAIYDIIGTSRSGWFEQQPYRQTFDPGPFGRPGATWVYFPTCHDTNGTTSGGEEFGGCKEQLIPYIRGAAGTGSYLALSFHSIVSDDQCGTLPSGEEYECCGLDRSCDDFGGTANEYPLNDYLAVLDVVKELQDDGLMLTVNGADISQRIYETDPINKLANPGFGSRATDGEPDGWIAASFTAEQDTTFDPRGNTNMICRSMPASGTVIVTQNLEAGAVEKGKNYWGGVWVKQRNYDSGCSGRNSTYAQIKTNGPKGEYLRGKRWIMDNTPALDDEWVDVWSDFVADTDQHSISFYITSSGCTAEELCLMNPMLIERQVQPSTADAALGIFSAGAPAGTTFCTTTTTGSVSPAGTSGVQTVKARTHTRGENVVPAYGQGHSNFLIDEITVTGATGDFDIDFLGRRASGVVYQSLDGLTAPYSDKTLSVRTFDDEAPSRYFSGVADGGGGGWRGTWPWQSVNDTGTNEIHFEITNNDAGSQTYTVRICGTLEGV